MPHAPQPGTHQSGFTTENLLLFQLLPRQAGYQGVRLMEFYDRVQQSLAAIPGVRSAALTQLKLLAGAMSGVILYSVRSPIEATSAPTLIAHGE